MQLRMPWPQLQTLLAYPPLHFLGALPGAEHTVRPHASDFGRRLRFYLHPLPQSFHRDILERLAASPGVASECKPLRWPCTLDAVPTARTSSGHVAAIFWQYLAEVVILQKFLALGALQASPAEADVVIVPALLSAGGFVSQYVLGVPAYQPWGAHATGDTGQFSFAELRGALGGTGVEGRTQRHLFLRTSDCHFSEWSGGPPPPGVPCDWMSTDFMPGRGDFFVSLGARNGTSAHHWGHIVVPPLVIEEEFQPKEWAGEDPASPRPLLVFLQCSPGIHPGRRRFVEAIRPYAQAYPDRVVLVTMDGLGRAPRLSQREAIRRMRSSTFCPVPAGDLPFTTRYFFAVLSGCIPVVVRYRGGGWWRRNGPSVEETYPWASRRIDHRAMAVEVPEDRLEELVPLLAALSDAEIVKRRALVFAQRARLVYDFSGSTPDAFSTLLEELEEALKPEQAPSSPDAPPLVPGVRPLPPRPAEAPRAMQELEEALKPECSEGRPEWPCAPGSPKTAKRCGLSSSLRPSQRRQLLLRCCGGTEVTGGGAACTEVDFTGCCGLGQLLPLPLVQEVVAPFFGHRLRLRQSVGSQLRSKRRRRQAIVVHPEEYALTQWLESGSAWRHAAPEGYRSARAAGLGARSTGMLATATCAMGIPSVLTIDSDPEALALSCHNVLSASPRTLHCRTECLQLNVSAAPERHRWPEPVDLLLATRLLPAAGGLQAMDFLLATNGRAYLAETYADFVAANRTLTPGFAVRSVADAHALGYLPRPLHPGAAWLLLEVRRRGSS